MVHRTAKRVVFFVPGVPRPGGSKNAFKNKHTGKVMVVEAGKYTKEWRANVAHFGFNAILDHEAPLLDCALSLRVTFQFVRPQSHYGSGRNANKLKDSAPHFHTKRPDTTKLLRALEDALSGVIWVDDAQVVTQVARKVYADKPGAHVIVELCGNNELLFEAEGQEVGA